MIKSLIQQIQKSEQEAERILRKAQRNAEEIRATSDAKISEETSAILTSARAQAAELIADAQDKAQNDIDAMVAPSQPNDVDARITKAANYLIEIIKKKYES